MLHPRYHVAKTYYVEVNDVLGPDAPAFFESGVVFEDGTVCQSAQLEILSSASDKSCARITISEGKVSSSKKDVFGLWGQGDLSQAYLFRRV